MMSRLKPSSESFTAILDSDDSLPLIGQVGHTTGDRSARLNFFAPDRPSEDDRYAMMLDFLVFQSGEMGAINLLAEVEESHFVFEILRKGGFSVYGSETIWKFPPKFSSGAVSKGQWQTATPVDETAIRALYQCLVPPLVQNAEPFINNGTPRLVYRTKDGISAYIENKSGHLGIYLKPVIHPSVNDVDSMLGGLVNMFTASEKPLYMQVRSYQAWLLDPLQKIGGESSTRFALMVKHLGLSQRVAVTQAQPARADRRQTEPTIPMVNNLSNSTGKSEQGKSR
jgi:hypothetical protein